MKIAIVGTGIAGNVVAHALYAEHDIEVFEAGSHVGGHTHTHEIELGGVRHAVDTGFIVFNDRTYPEFNALLNSLGVKCRDTEMSFSVRDERCGLEYNGTTLNSLFAQRRNLMSPRFLGMLRDIVRFNRAAPKLLYCTAANEGVGQTLADYLRDNSYGAAFIEQYIVPMGAAIWSSREEDVLRFPAHFFVRFFHNHGMLSVNDRPQWRTICGGSARYVDALVAPFRDRIHLRTPVHRIWRTEDGVLVKAGEAAPTHFDAVFLACHADQSLAILGDPSPAERAVLSAIPYGRNEVVLHTDASLLPRQALARAAWNYHLTAEPGRPVAVTYDMNRLQGIASPKSLLVTLNRHDAIDSRQELIRLSYHHPLFTPAAVAAQARQREINGPLNTYFCGAYWRYGFHEDGVASALAALRHFAGRLRQGAELPHPLGTGVQHA